MSEIAKVYEISVEPSGDYIFTASGVVVLYQNGRFRVYSESAKHNFLRRAISRHAWAELLETVVEQDTSVRLRDVTDDVQNKYGPSAISTEAVLSICYKSNPKQLFFLERYL